jgi:hypothetical protein
MYILIETEKLSFILELLMRLNIIFSFETDL